MSSLERTIQDLPAEKETRLKLQRENEEKDREIKQLREELQTLNYDNSLLIKKFEYRKKNKEAVSAKKSFLVRKIWPSIYVEMCRKKLKNIQLWHFWHDITTPLPKVTIFDFFSSAETAANPPTSFWGWK